MKSRTKGSGQKLKVVAIDDVTFHMVGTRRIVLSDRYYVPVLFEISFLTRNYAKMDIYSALDQELK